MLKCRCQQQRNHSFTILKSCTCAVIQSSSHAAKQSSHHPPGSHRRAPPNLEAPRSTPCNRYPPVYQSDVTFLLCEGGLDLEQGSQLRCPPCAGELMRTGIGRPARRNRGARGARERSSQCRSSTQKHMQYCTSVFAARFDNALYSQHFGHQINITSCSTP